MSEHPVIVGCRGPDSADAVRLGLDLLVCVSRGHGRPLAAILGSVSTHLVTHAQCPVVVVPPGVWRKEAGPLGITSAAAND
jgi:hypothetical protein